MFKFAIWLAAAFFTSFLIPIPGCVIPAMMIMASITVGLLIAE